MKPGLLNFISAVSILLPSVVGQLSAQTPQPDNRPRTASIGGRVLDISIQAQPAETKAETATISGRVSLKGEPARGVMVILQAWSQGAFNSPRARTDENGRFHFTGLPAGRYSVFAVAPGYVSPEDNYDIGRRGKALNLTDGEKVKTPTWRSSAVA
ncbi:MAG: carboxypeptidase-like regulatory domain-containing protein [Blastocatellia bacterium]